MLGSIIVAATCVANLTLGLAILLRTRQRQVGLAFFSVTAAVSLWAVSNHLTIVPHRDLTYNDIFNRLAFCFAFLAVASGQWFTAVFPVALGLSRRAVVTLVAFGVTVAALSSTTLVSGTVSRTATGLKFSNGPLLLAYAACLALFLGLIMRNLVRAARIGHGLVRQQAVYISIAFALPVLLGLTTNTVIPSLTADWSLADLGPLFTFLFVGLISYTIVRHHLFDLRLAIARSLAYVSSVFAVVSAYAILALVLLDKGFSLHINAAEGIALALFTAVAVLLFQPIKRVFDKLTNRIFYQDAYDSQHFFNDLNSTLASTILLQDLLQRTAATISRYLKSEYCLLSVHDGHDLYRSVGTTTKKYSSTELEYLRHWIGGQKQAVVVVDDLPPEHKDVQETLSAQGIALCAQITMNVSDPGAALGYIILGPKKSGNPYTAQDVSVLQAAASGLVTAIQNALRFEEIHNFNATLQARVDDATKKLRHANEQLKQLDESKDDFISMASHQLRTPLTSIKGYVSMVLEEDAGKINEKQRDMLSQAFFSSQRMVYLIADLLNISRLKTGKFTVEASRVNLATLVEQEIGQLKESAVSRHLVLTYHKPESFPDLTLDETKTRQVIMNFVDNAIYYTPAGGHINVRLIDNPTAVELRVEDDGIGVPRSEQPHLFTKFYRAPNARKARPDGTGLGLFMAKKVIIAQKGAIIFESEVGKGSTFGFRFSKAMAAPRPTSDSGVTPGSASSPRLSPDSSRPA